MRKILVTTGLVYANGQIHLGHLLEQVQADIWVRFQKLLGNDCLFLSGDDTHGTPIMLAAEKNGMQPEEFIQQIKIDHERDARAFLIDFDNYYTTHSTENRELTEQIYQKLLEHDDIETKTILQAYDPIKNIFLPDRFIKGECPCCGAKDQYGDSCENCGSTYATAELKNPVSVISGATPIKKESLHYFFKLGKHAEMLKEWLEAGHVQEEIKNKLLEWFKEGLKSWDISRDAPYFGFLIPGTTDKYFYVWLDAPIGYIASFTNLAKRQNDLNFADYWQSEDKTELYHFIGKDIIYFHALFWPAVLTSADLRKPTGIFTHGYLTINNQKISKSRGMLITAADYLKYLDPEYLRYYFAAKLHNRVDDIDLNLEDFRNRVNSDLIGKFINIASRCANFINNKFENRLSDTIADQLVLDNFIAAKDRIAELYENREYSIAIREIMALADKANQYIDEKKPWIIAKDETRKNELQEVCTMGLNLFNILAIYLKPVLPKTVKNIEQFLNIQPVTWDSLSNQLTAHVINKFAPLMLRIDEQQIKNLLQNV
jgi:methionyl-tRNA synthetase